MTFIRIRVRKGKEESNIVCLYFNSKFTGSDFIGDTFEKQGNINRDIHCMKGEGQAFFFPNLFKLFNK